MAPRRRKAVRRVAFDPVEDDLWRSAAGGCRPPRQISPEVCGKCPQGSAADLVRPLRQMSKEISLGVGAGSRQVSEEVSLDVGTDLPQGPEEGATNVKIESYIIYN